MTKEVWTEAKFQRLIKEGRGQGELADYRPWIEIQTYRSQGRSSRVMGWKTGRIHHFLSDNELRYFYLLDFEDAVIDIREHFPLLDLKEVLNDMSDIDLAKYRDKESGTPHVFTTTFLITLQDSNGEPYHVARNMKQSHELEKSRTLERFEILRRYFKRKEIDWGMVTQKELPMARVKNIEWIHDAKNLDGKTGITDGELVRLIVLLREQLIGNAEPIRAMTSAYDRQLNLESGSGLLFFRHLLATKAIEVNMNKPIDLGQPANLLIQAINGGRGECREGIDRQSTTPV